MVLVERVEDLFFANDLFLLTHTHTDMEAKLQDREREARALGLRVNAKEINAMEVTAKNKQKSRVSDEGIGEGNN